MPEPQTAILSFPDGVQYLIHDPDQDPLYAFFDELTGAVLHGGRIHTKDEGGQSIYFWEERRLGACKDRAGFCLALAAKAQGISAMPDSDENKQHIRALVTQHTVSTRPVLTIKTRLAGDVPLHALPLAPWTADIQHVYDAQGEVAYSRVTLPMPAPVAQATSNFLAGLRKLLGGGRGTT